MAILAHPDAQPYTARLAGAGSMLRELEAVLDVAPATANATMYRDLILDRNAAQKSSATARMWAWKRLKLRYLLDSPMTPEFRAFRSAFDSSASGASRQMVAGLMFARTDALFRDVTLEVVSPNLSQTAVVSSDAVRVSVERKMRAAELDWSHESVASITNHVLSALADFGLVEGYRVRRTARVHPRTEPTVFAARLGRLEGLTDRANLQSRWFAFLGLGVEEAVAALREATRTGAVGFRMQADVVELVLPEAG